MKKGGLIIILIFSQLLIKLSAQNLCEGLILYYPFDGNVEDFSGNHFNGEIHGAVLASDRHNNSNSAYYFGGYTDFIDFPNSTILKPSLPFSVAFWVNFSDLERYYSIFTNDYLEDVYTGCCIVLNPKDNGSFICISYGDGGGTPNGISSEYRRSKTGNTKINSNQWYHVVAVFRGPTDMDIYLDGINDNGNYDGSGSGLAYSNNPGSIGRKDRSYNIWLPSYYYLHGKMDEVAFWCRSLTQDDVTELYMNGIKSPPNVGFFYNTNDRIVSFYDSSEYCNTWLWDFGDGTSSTLQNPIHEYPEFQTYFVSLTVGNNCGTVTQIDTIVLSCPKPIAKFTYDIEGSEVHFHDSSSSATFWYWNFGDSTFSTLQDPIHIYQNPGNYCVCLVVKDTCGMNVHCDSISLLSPLKPLFTYEIQNNFVQFTDTTNSHSFWKWDFGDGTGSDKRNPLHFFNSPGTFIVCLNTGSPLFSETSCSPINILSDGIPLNYDNFFEIYPNPADIEVNIKGIVDNNSIGKLQLFNTQGLTIRNFEIQLLADAFSYVLDLRKIESGVYYLMITINDISQVKKLVICHQ